MERYFAVLRNCPLFDKIEDEQLNSLLTCLGAWVEHYQKDETIFAEGAPARHLGIVLQGTAQIVMVDYYGNRSIVASVEETEIFGETFACAEVEALPVNVVAASDMAVLLMDVQRVTHTCNNACSFHNRIIFNLMKVVATKNLVFHQKIEITAKRSTRDKLMTYLLIQAKKHGRSTFTVPYDRQALADYLEVERSGLSATISKLRKEGVLECDRSTFTLL